MVSLTVTIFSEKCLFLLDAYVVSCPIQSKNIERTLICMHIPVVLAAKPKFMDEDGGVYREKCIAAT